MTAVVASLSCSLLTRMLPSVRNRKAFPPDSLSTIGYTSGTTGHPKGACLSHRSIVLNVAMTALMHQRSDRDTVVTALPCPHVYGNVVMSGAVQSGMTLVLHPVFDEQAVLESIQTHRATMFEGVPTMFMFLLNHPDLDRYDLSSLRCCTVGGQTMPKPSSPRPSQKLSLRPDILRSSGEEL